MIYNQSYLKEIFIKKENVEDLRTIRLVFFKMLEILT